MGSEMPWNSCGIMSAMSRNSACDVLNLTYRGTLGLRTTVMKSARKTPNARNGTPRYREYKGIKTGRKMLAMSGTCENTTRPKDSESNSGIKYGRIDSIRSVGGATFPPPCLAVTVVRSRRVADGSPVEREREKKVVCCGPVRDVHEQPGSTWLLETEEEEENRAASGRNAGRRD